MANGAIGLRQRKKQRTRDTIIDVALRLFDSQGYDETTVVQIAEEAEIAPSTFFTYFPTKEEVVFERYDAFALQFDEYIDNRPGNQSTIEAFDELIRPLIVEFQDVSELGVLRYRVIESHPELRKSRRQRFNDMMESTLRAGFARDLGDEPHSARVQILAGATVGAFTGFEATKMAGLESGTASLEDQLAMFDAFLTAVRAALDALTRS
jgi:AcrR family transcriptional regulator